MKPKKPKYILSKHGNEPLPKPYRTRARIIHKNVNFIGIGPVEYGKFLPSWDDTDHFQFVCNKCHCAADILTVKFVREYTKTAGSAIYFFLGCPCCGRVGQRKIYLGIRDDICKFQHTFTDDRKVLLYGDQRKPHSTIQFQPKRKKKT